MEELTQENAATPPPPARKFLTKPAGAALTIALIGAAVAIWVAAGQRQTTPSPSGETSNPSGTASETQFSFDNPKKSAHYESNTPAHASVLAAPPINIVLDFNFDLHSSKSTIEILKDGKDYGVGGVTVDTNKLTMRRNFDPSAPDGVYTVKYSACWPDGSCHDGQFQFAIDRTRAAGYTDLRGQDEVTVRLKDIAFSPMSIRIDKGTKVTWVNDDSVGHYVNTDSHPYHTYFKEQNSQLLNSGDRYSVTFNTAGAYPYHCSAHTEMTGQIIVE